jgi:predicted O-methyltransferase YrrM
MGNDRTRGKLPLVGPTLHIPTYLGFVVCMFVPLPSVNCAKGIRKGRNPYEGYQRGWALNHPDSLAKIENEPLYKNAFNSIQIPSWITPPKRANLYLIITRFLTPLADRNIIEFGSYRGGTALFMALVLREVAPEASVFALDTFEGMPQSDKSVDAHTMGDFADNSLPALKARIDELGLKNIVPVQGLFEETFPALQHLRFGVAHIDADIYHPIKYAQNAVLPCMTKGGYIVHDDAAVPSCLGATEAVEDFVQEHRSHSEQAWPHFVFRTGLA